MIATAGLGEFALAHRDEILRLAGQHLGMAVAATALAAATGIPAGIALARRPRLAAGALGVANAVQTIPSLALFGLLIPLPLLGGIGARSAIIAIWLYGLLPILRNTVTGLRGLDPAVVEAATGLGMTPAQRLRLVELPLAMPVILAGVRVAAVLSVGTATIAAAIGAGGLGELIFRGVATVDARLIACGAVPAAVLALAVDLILALLERAASPRRSSRQGVSR